MTTKNKQQNRLKRKARVRKKVTGTTERPRLSVFRSARHIYAQVIDDTVGQTLVKIHSYKKGSTSRASKEKCEELGQKLAELCKSQNISRVVFDRNGYAYHGRVKAFADGARKGGLDF